MRGKRKELKIDGLLGLFRSQRSRHIHLFWYLSFCAFFVSIQSSSHDARIIWAWLNLRTICRARRSDLVKEIILRDVTSTGYTFVPSPRLNGIGGGVGMLYRTNLKVQQLNSDPYKSFEFKELLLHSDNCISRIIMVYRSPISVKNGRTHAGFFFYQFSMLLERLVSSPGNLLLNGGFNFHVNYPSDSTTSQFLDLLNCFYLDIFNLRTPTRVKNNVLDLIITRSGETSVSNLSVHDSVISDHFNLQSTAAWLSRNHLTRNSLSWLENYATLIQTVYVLIFAPLH